MEETERAADRRSWLRPSAGRAPFAWALVLQIPFVAFAPLFGGRPGIAAIALSLYYVSIVLSVVASTRQPSIRRVAAVLAGAGAVAHIARYLAGHVEPTLWLMTVDATLCGATPLIVVRYVLGQSDVTTDRLLGAVSSYLLIGVFFGILYVLVAHVVPGAFAGSGVRDAGDAVYFSFTTLTTVGYGDIQPVHPVVRGLAMMEAVLGPVYLAILVARLVSLHSRSGNDARRDPPTA